MTRFFGISLVLAASLVVAVSASAAPQRLDQLGTGATMSGTDTTAYCQGAPCTLVQKTLNQTATFLSTLFGGDFTCISTLTCTLASVNATVGSYTNANITVDAKGRITAASNGSSAAGGTVTQNGNLTSNNLVIGGTNGTSDVKATPTGTGILAMLGINKGSAGAPAANNGDTLTGTFNFGSATFSGNGTFSGIPKFTGISTGTIAAGGNLGLDASNNLVKSTAGSGVSQVCLNPGEALTPGTRNNGSDCITSSGTISQQLFPVTKSSSYSVNSDNGGVSDTGALLIATGGSVTFTLPVPAAGSKGNSYQFGSDGTNGFTLTAGGTAKFYGFSGTAATSGDTTVSFPANRDVVCVDDATNYKCSMVASPITPVALTWAPGINPNNLPLANISEPKIIVGIRCTPEVLAGGAATIQPVKAASATAISAGTNLTSTTCNANSGAATDQNLTMSVTTLAAGDRLGIKTTGTTIWTSSGVAAGVITVFLR